MRFDSAYGPGTVVTVGTRDFPMPHTTEDPREIELLLKAPGVFVVPAPTTITVRNEAANLTPEEAAEAAETYKLKPKTSRKEV